MRYTIFIVIIMFATTFALNAQIVQQTLQPQADSAKVVRMPLADSSLVGTTIFQLLDQQKGNGSVQLNQPAGMDEAYAAYLKSNGEKKRNGYRVRLFFDNKQTARVASDTLEQGFKLRFPEIPTYRSYTNPFFKVVVGDYRTKSDAIRALNRILPFYPKAIVVRETIYFPEI